MICMESIFFTSYEINSYTTLIVGLAGENCVLFEGNERALLFDGLTGAGSLKAFVRELTDKPVFMVLSHAHPDHEGAVFESPVFVTALTSADKQSFRHRLSFSHVL